MTSQSKLYCEGKGFSLPHTDLESLAVEVALRSSDADFVFGRPNGNFSGRNLPTLHVSSKTPRTATSEPKEEELSSKGVADIFALLARNGKDIDADLNNDQRLFGKTGALAFLHQVLPAYNYITLALDEHHSVRHSNRTDPNSMLAYGLGLLGLDRSAELKGIEEQYRIASLSGALNAAASGLKAFEEVLRVIATTGNSSSASSGFAFGTAKPTRLDCLAFAACSGLLYAEFSATYGEIRAWQAEQRNEVPRLMALTEAVRVAVFSTTNNHFFSLKPILPSADSSAYDGEKPFREGRLRFLTLTAAFAGLYFLVTNAATLVTVLEAMEGADGDDDDDEE